MACFLSIRPILSVTPFISGSRTVALFCISLSVNCVAPVVFGFFWFSLAFLMVSTAQPLFFRAFFDYLWNSPSFDYKKIFHKKNWNSRVYYCFPQISFNVLLIVRARLYLCLLWHFEQLQVCNYAWHSHLKYFHFFYLNWSKVSLKCRKAYPK